MPSILVRALFSTILTLEKFVRPDRPSMLVSESFFSIVTELHVTKFDKASIFFNLRFPSNSPPIFKLPTDCRDDKPSRFSRRGQSEILKTPPTDCRLDKPFKFVKLLCLEIRKFIPTEVKVDKLSTFVMPEKMLLMIRIPVTDV